MKNDTEKLIMQKANFLHCFSIRISPPPTRVVATKYTKPKKGLVCILELLSFYFF